MKAGHRDAIPRTFERRVAEVRDRIRAAAALGGHRHQVRIVAITKGHGPDAAAHALAAGIPDAGENRVQEALLKMEGADPAIKWHLVGHLQRNKVRHLDRFVLFHALDSSRIADALHFWGVARGKPAEVLMQVNASGEGTKGGFAVAAVSREATRLASLEGLRVAGVMTIARLGAGERELRETFGYARDARQMLVRAGHPATELSMGMSQDYEIAVEEGATIVRLGTVLFGERS